MAGFLKRGLYGNAITVELPPDYIDSSDIRQIPSHQECYLSTTTLTSIIFEINQYQHQQQQQQQQQHEPSAPTDTDTDADAAAITYHFNDIIDPDDRLLHPLPAPQPTTMPQPSLTKFPAYTLTGTVVSTETTKPPPTSSALPRAWQTQQQTQQQQQQQQTHETVDVHTVIHQLVVRMQPFDTDLCVRVNVPLKELTGEGAEAGSQVEAEEVKLGQTILKRVVETLKVEDFGLFDG